MDEIIAEIITFINDRKGLVSVSDLAEHFGYSIPYFSREFKRLNGVNPVEYIASVKVVASIANIDAYKSINHAHVNAGYLSTGTFSNNFKAKTGLTPLKYKNTIKPLYTFMKTVEKSEESFAIDYTGTIDYQHNRLHVHCIAPDHFEGMIFIGLFKKRIPNHPPVLGKVIRQTQTLVFENIPDGTYYLMSCGIPKSFNKLNYFFLKDEYRCFIEEALVFPSKTLSPLTLRMRPKLPTDPPLTFNLPQLLFSQLKKQQKRIKTST